MSLSEFDEIFSQYKKDRREYRDLEWEAASLPAGREKILISGRLAAVGKRIRRVERSMDILTREERIRLHYRYVYSGKDWVWQRTSELFLCRTAMYKRLRKGKEKFLDRYRSSE